VCFLVCLALVYSCFTPHRAGPWLRTTAVMHHHDSCHALSCVGPWLGWVGGVSPLFPPPCGLGWWGGKVHVLGCIALVELPLHCHDTCIELCCTCMTWLCLYIGMCFIFILHDCMHYALHDCSPIPLPCNGLGGRYVYCACASAWLYLYAFALLFYMHCISWTDDPWHLPCISLHLHGLYLFGMMHYLPGAQVHPFHCTCNGLNGSLI
jgi:hypothetical protein